MKTNVDAGKIKRKSHPWYVKTICICMMTISFSIFLDFITAIEKVIVIDNVEVFQYEQRGKYSSTYTKAGYLLKIQSGDLFFNIKNKRDFLDKGDLLLIKYTPLYKMILKMDLYKNGEVYKKDPPEGIFNLLQGLLFLIFSIFSIALFVNYGDVSIKLIIMGFLLLGLTYFIFGLDNYFEPY